MLFHRKICRRQLSRSYARRCIWSSATIATTDVVSQNALGKAPGGSSICGLAQLVGDVV